MSLAKRLFVVALGAFIWLLAPSALAAAPRCDVRAATTFAPPPTLEDPSSSIDLGDAGCAPSIPLDMLHQGRAANEVAFSSSPDFTLSSLPVVASAPRTGALPHAWESSNAPAGVKTSVDRPPR